jgi:uncharacterized membrane protein
MRIASTGHAVFAVAMIALGAVGVFYPEFVPLWSPVPTRLPARELFLYLGPAISIASGIGLLVPRTAAIVSRVLLATLLLWLLFFRLPNVFRVGHFEACWSVFPLLLMISAAWLSYAWFGSAWDRQHLALVSGTNGLRIARVLFGLCLIFFGAAHFIDVADTVSLIPHWLPFHLFWAYFTGSAFIAAGLAILVGFWARLAAGLATVQIGMFLLLVWMPIVAAGSKVPFVWSETILNSALLAGAWMVSDSYREVPDVAV